MTNTVIASGAWRSRSYLFDRSKERLLRRLNSPCHRERSVAISVVIDGQGVKIEIASQARNDKCCHRERNVAISVVLVGKEENE